jgi:hypothetical protein
MKIRDVIVEARAGDLTINDIKIVVDRHAIDRVIQRNVSPIGVDKVLKKLPVIADKLNSVDQGQQFWVWDHVLEIALGFRKINSGIHRYVLKTILGTRPWDSHVLVIEV